MSRKFNASRCSLRVGDLAPEKCRVLSFNSTGYGVAQQYQGFLRVLSKERLEKFTSKGLCVEWSFQAVPQYLHGHLFKTVWLGRQGKEYLYELYFSSPLHRLLTTENNRIFVDKSLKEIIHAVLTDHGFFSALDYQVLAKGGWGSTRRPFTAQFNQSDWSFLLRLLHRFGWYCIWQQTKEYAKLIFYNNNEQLPRDLAQLYYVPDAGMVTDKPHIYELKNHVKNFHDGYIFTEYNYETPDIKLMVSSQNQTNIPADGIKEVDGMHYGTLEEGTESIRHAQEALDFLRESVTLLTNHSGLLVGQLLEVKDHPVVELNKTYRVVNIDHHINEDDSVEQNASHYEAKVMLVPAERQLRLYHDLYERPATELLVQAKIYGNNADLPDLDEQGRYKIQFMFDPKETVVPHMRTMQVYAGQQKAKPTGIHHPLRHGTDVLVGFMNGDIDRPVILGALSTPEAPNPVSSKNATQHRLRTWGGHELLFEDNKQKPSINLHTSREEQRLHLNATQGAECVQLASNTGEMHLYAKDNMAEESGDDHVLKVGGTHEVNVGGSQYVKTETGSMKFTSAKNLSLKAGKNLRMQTIRGDLNLNSEGKLMLNAKKDIGILAKKGHLVLKSQGDIKVTAQRASIQAPKINIGPMSLEGGNALFGGMIFNAPHIDWYYPAGAGLANASSGKVKRFKRKNPLAQQPVNFQALIAVCFRNDPGASERYFSNKVKKEDQYFHKETLSADEVQYFKNNGNNVTIFIHGYNVPYGEFGEKISSAEKEKLQASILSRVDVLRAREDVLENFPNAKVDNKFIGSLEERRKQDFFSDPLYADLMENHIKDPGQYLNGDGAHNWWLRMEWNLNTATGQFNGSDFKNYTRILNVAWHGDPKSPLDYMADIETAQYAGEKLVTVIEQLRAASSDMQINIIAHSLGNYVLLKAMDILGATKPNILNHVFMWEPAVPDNALSAKPPPTTPEYYRFPKASTAAKKITVLYSEHDNILGPVLNDQTDFWEKRREEGSAAAATVFSVAEIDKVIARQNSWTTAPVSGKQSSDTMQEMAALAGTGMPMSGVAVANAMQMQRFGNGIVARPLKSIYLLANLLGKPVNYLMDTMQAVQYYQEFRRKYHYTEYQDGKPQQKVFPMQISELERLFKKHSLHVFALIATVIQVFSELPLSFGKGIETFKLTLNSEVEPYWVLNQHPKATQAAAVVLAVLASNKPEPRTAMGYKGFDINDDSVNQLYEAGKLQPVNQTKWLFSHSGMRIPSPALMQHVYIDKILGAKGYQLGVYKRLDPRRSK